MASLVLCIASSRWPKSGHYCFSFCLKKDYFDGFLRMLSPFLTQLKLKHF